MKLRAIGAAGMLAFALASNAGAVDAEPLPGCRVRVYQEPAGLDAVREPAPDQSANADVLCARLDLSSKTDFGGFEDDFVAVVTASFEVKTQGAYEFRLTSDDGAILFVDGRPVVRHDGLHAATARTGSVNLKAGVRAIKVLMFEAQGEQALKLR